ncbi:MAG: hypothetical protein GYB68_19090 [Chloroflexi bacterium]|nr:hypothetical protein [Chloroflexota bacterium]
MTHPPVPAERSPLPILGGLSMLMAGLALGSLLPLLLSLAITAWMFGPSNLIAPQVLIDATAQQGTALEVVSVLGMTCATITPFLALVGCGLGIVGAMQASPTRWLPAFGLAANLVLISAQCVLFGLLLLL